MEAGYNHVPCRFSSFSDGDIQGIGGWAKLNKSTPFSTVAKVELRNSVFVCGRVCAWTFPIEVGLCPAKLPVIWDTGSDQSIVSAS